MTEMQSRDGPTQERHSSNLLTLLCEVGFKLRGSPAAPSPCAPPQPVARDGVLGACSQLNTAQGATSLCSARAWALLP